MQLKEIISKDLEITKERKTMSINIDSYQIEEIDKIAYQFSKINNSKTFTRKYIIETAIDAYIEEAKEILEKQYKINIKDLPKKKKEKKEENFDLVIFPAREEGFQDVFLGEREWRYVRIDKNKINKIKYIAIYRSAPISGITHYAKVKSFEYNEEYKKYSIILEGKPIRLEKIIKLEGLDPNAMRSGRYVELSELKNAKNLKELLENKD